MSSDREDRIFRTAWVLGARGFLGRRVVAELAGAGIVIDEHAPELIVHAAGLVGSEANAALRTAHVETTQKLLKRVQGSNRNARVVVIGSAAELGLMETNETLAQEREAGAPLSAYGRSKCEQSQVAREMAVHDDLDVVRVRVFNTLGPGQSTALVAGAMVERLMKALQTGAALSVHNPGHVRDFLDARDIARCLRIVAQRLPRQPGRVPVNLCSGRGTTIRTLSEELMAGAKANVALTFTGDEGAGSRMVGTNATLTGLMRGAAIQTISTARSLAEMWHWRVNGASESQGAA